MQNRLQLNFQLQTTEERRDFVNKYIIQEKFQTYPLTQDELETIANYILWGKDPDGLNCTQRKEIQIETKNKTWNRQDTDSLDAMMESPSFNEAALRKTTEPRIKFTKENFDRESTLQECPSYMFETFQELFHRIDTIELGLNFYELAHGKRKEPPRHSLLSHFAKPEIDSIQQTAAKWNQYKYLKQRHLIVELRREQFTLRDSFKEVKNRKAPPEPIEPPDNLDFGAEIPVYPLGLIDTPIGGLVFREIQKMNPKSFTDSEIEKIVKLYWSKKDESRPQFFFDFENEKHLYALFDQLEELEESIDTLPVESNLGKLLNTLKYYVQMADLTDAQREILNLKIEKTKNADIAFVINKKYNKTYTANYISTIFCKKIIPRIIETAHMHSEICCNLCFPENFKRCSCCGKILLIIPENFVRKARSRDGFANKCKICDRNDRQKKR